MGVLKNAKHERFCQEYIIDLNATQAYIRVGYAGGQNAEVNASKLLRNTKVQERIAELKGRVGEKLEIKAEDIANEFRKLGYFNSKDLLDEEGKPIPFHKLPREITACVREMKPMGTDEQGNIIYDLKFFSKERSLEMLGKHVGFFEKHNEQKQPIVNLTPEQQLERLNDLKRRIEKTKERENSDG